MLEFSIYIMLIYNLQQAPQSINISRIGEVTGKIRHSIAIHRSTYMFMYNKTQGKISM